MSAKRALIVDDSKSARAFLARILERYELAVDTAESAEHAIEYLTRSQPDVIFMDHLMPGMDGFQAVQSIKNNPRTAMIPIMMYTSQEGELYLGQARALGAIGVMPKQIRPADVSKVLYQLKLLPDRRGGDQTSFTPANSTALVATAPATTTDTDSTIIANNLALGAEIRQMVDSVVREHVGDLRRGIAVGLDKQSERLLGDVKAAVSELMRLLRFLPPQSTERSW
jgi:CheY-like chemotaxis protein